MGNLPLDASTSFSTPYIHVSIFTSAKNLVFCDGHLYQIWRNAASTVSMRLPGVGRCHIEHEKIFVLRYDPQRLPCRDVLTDLRGHLVFVGRNKAVSIYAEGVPGLKGDCVYWIGGRGSDGGMVYDIKTGRSIPCIPLMDGEIPEFPQSSICWYILRGE